MENKMFLIKKHKDTSVIRVSKEKSFIFNLKILDIHRNIQSGFM